MIDRTRKIISFILLLTVYLFTKLGKYIFPKLRLNQRLISILDIHSSNSISGIEIIDLALRNMKSKKTRTLITIGGMTLGIGAIVFLVSIGYGFEKLVITRVARLEEMRQADITTQLGGKVKIDDKTLSDLKGIQTVESVFPLIAVVGRVSYQKSVTDTAVYGVTSEYLNQSAIKPVSGQIFNSNDLSLDVYQPIGKVAGITSETEVGTIGEKIQDVDFTINPESWIKVRANPNTNSQILGYTKRVEGQSSGQEVWGGEYQIDNNQKLEKWIKAPVLLWKKEGAQYLVINGQDNSQIQETGYFAEINLQISGASLKEPDVLGVVSNQSNLDWVEIASESATLSPPATKIVDLSSQAKRQAVVNRAMLSVLGIKESEALTKRFNASFIVVSDLLNDPTTNIESSQAEYSIVGVTPDEKTPVFYVPFIDLRTLGITNFSQVKVVVKNQNELSKTRRQIESMGYITRSVADTVAQINSLFATARTILMVLGMVALGVAALGMFNTLTISLLERTREVGLMKAMGMKSSEVQELFLAESVIMGFLGGVFGILLGWILGKFIGLSLSFFSFFKGVGVIDVAHIPTPFIITIVFLSLLVGLLTGIYPAKRSTRISALNALRYE